MRYLLAVGVLAILNLCVGCADSSPPPPTPEEAAKTAPVPIEKGPAGNREEALQP